MDIEYLPALIAGLVGGAVMFAMRLMMKAAGVDLKMDVARMWGTMMKIHGTAGLMVGLLIHLVVSALIALIYVWAFKLLGADDLYVLWGLLGGAIHWVIAGVFLAMVPAMHPEMPERVTPPGAFAKNFGAPDVPIFLVGHLLYGAVVAVLYAYLHTNGGSDIAF